jgi:riboflavin synthase
MFSGIIEETGIARSLAPTDGGARLVVETRSIAAGVAIGDSVAVNGCCLTAVSVSGPVVEFDLLAETLRRTNLGDLKPGSPVNLERSLAADGRIGGHFVQGHIDAASEVLALDPAGSDHRLEIALPAEFARYVAFKGSIAIDGISLTVAELHPDRFVIWLIPHTMAATNLGSRAPGDRVNLEFDMLAKYVERILEARR